MKTVNFKNVIDGSIKNLSDVIYNEILVGKVRNRCCYEDVKGLMHYVKGEMSEEERFLTKRKAEKLLNNGQKLFIAIICNTDVDFKDTDDDYLEIVNLNTILGERTLVYSRDEESCATDEPIGLVVQKNETTGEIEYQVAELKGADMLGPEELVYYKNIEEDEKFSNLIKEILEFVFE